MSYIGEIFNAFNVDEFSCAKENFLYYKATANCSDYSYSDDSLEVICGCFSKAKSNDFVVSIALDSPSPISLSSESTDIKNALYGIQEAFELNSGSKFLFELTINKKNESNVFDFKEFIRYLASSTIENNLADFSRFLNDSDGVFDVWDDISAQICNGFVFRSKDCRGKVEPSSDKGSRADYVLSRSKVSHFSNDSIIQFTPEDFKDKSVNDQDLSMWLSKIRFALSLIYLSDYSVINGDILDVRMKGYKLITAQIDYGVPADYSEDLFEIYQWVYNGGDLADKIGLARNIISLHLRDEKTIGLSRGVIDSIKSGYDLYLKENVKQYIEIKNKISEFLLSQSDSAASLTKGMFGMFKTSFWSIVTFFFGVFFLRSIASNNAMSNSSNEIFIVSVSLILISFIYLIVCRVEISIDRKSLVKRYEEVKRRYVDLINSDDLDSIIDVNREVNSVNEFIDNKLQIYTNSWIASNVIFFCVSIFLFKSEYLLFIWKSIVCY